MRVFVLIAFLLVVQTGFGQNSKSFEIPEGVVENPFYKSVFQVYEGELYYLNTYSARQGLYVYDWRTGEFNRKISIDRAGAGFRSFRVLSRDSIIFFSEYYKESFSMINSSSKHLGLFNMVGDQEAHPQLQGALSYNGNAVASHNGNVFLSKGVFYPQAYKTSAGLVAVDLASNESKVLPPLTESGLPEPTGRTFRYFSPSLVALPGGNILISYPFMEEVLVYNPVTEEVQKVEMSGHDLIPGLAKYPAHKGEGELAESKLYYNLLYNEAQKEIYRVVRVPTDQTLYKSYKDGYIEKLPPPNYAILKFNLNFEAEGFVLLPTDTHRVSHGLVVDEAGIWCLKRGEKEDRDMVFEKLQF